MTLVLYQELTNLAIKDTSNKKKWEELLTQTTIHFGKLPLQWILMSKKQKKPGLYRIFKLQEPPQHI